MKIYPTGVWYNMQRQRKEKALRRTKIIQGQIGGIHRMVEEERYCIDILVQIASVQEALRGVAREIVGNHLETCVTDGIKAGEGERYYEELTDIITKLMR